MIPTAKTAFALLAIAASGLVMAESAGQQKYPDIVDVEVMPSGENRFDFDVTVSSPYDSAERYADAFRVMSRDEAVFGVRELLHDHANEQPFTRRLSGIEIPPEVNEVIVQGRDQTHGYGGETVQVGLPGR
ncbi:hypothetical protein SAMN02745148_00749 [Modicisalibacter ilicicola DSM 19980]|uniref:Uncharacterized protein n=1 Tax=Modicisalibacter ilicicola DSM 19980 TaxID=1121942 RepID=A0A1M4UT29_9GAMM|nr:hypothetical protein [Halomonas ilicicola]SHE59854.1 hypothetical protein SAMN02745148_00749 [Halomonas ilicicola DSM 19980]